MYELPSSVLYSQLGLTAIIVSIILIVLSIIQVVGMWCTYQKMGRHDFAVLVPGYNLWEFARGGGLRSGFSTFFVLVFVVLMVCLCGYHQAFYAELFSDRVLLMNLFLSLAAGSTYAINLFTNAWTAQFIMHIQTLNPWLIASFVAGVIFLILYLRASYGVAKSFGHGFLFMLGIVLFPFVFFPVLGFSSSQRYRGPYYHNDLPEEGSDYWAAAVEARMQTFGSNAPLALAICGLFMTFTFMVVPAIVFYIIALVRNGVNKGKPLAGAKRVGTLVICVSGFVLSAVLVVSIVMVGNNLVNLLMTL